MSAGEVAVVNAKVTPDDCRSPYGEEDLKQAWMFSGMSVCRQEAGQMTAERMNGRGRPSQSFR